MSLFEKPRPFASSARDPLQAQAQAWVRRLSSGRAKPSDARDLQHWCTLSDAHAEAFRIAHRQWRELRPAAALAGQGDSELARLRATPVASPSGMSRRLFVGGAVAASAAAIGVALVDPPLGLWPSVEAMRADFSTDVGEQRSLALAPSVTVDMNTRSRIGVRTVDGQVRGIDLLVGEVSVDAAGTPQPFTVVAGTGRSSTTDGRFEVRRLAQGFCVTCLQGQVQVAAAGREIALRASQQVRYDAASLGAVLQIDAAALSPWREGILSFRNVALAEVVAEINRYRPGRVLLLARSLGDRPVSGRFRIDDLDKAIAQIQRLFRLELTTLPGAVVVLR